jgi:hypothetical protein
MKKTWLTTLLVASVLATVQAQTVDLLSLGSSTYTPDGGSFTPSQSATNLVQNLTVATGDNWYNNSPFTPVSSFDWSGYVNYGITMTLLGGSPDSVGFTVGLFDGSFAPIDTYDGSTGPLTLIGTPVKINFTGISTPGSGVYTDVQYLQFTWAGGGSVNVGATTVYGVVPEPSTYALLGLGGLALGGYAMRRRQRV